MEKMKVLKKWVYLALIVFVLLAFVLWFYFKEVKRQDAVLAVNDTNAALNESEGAKNNSKEIYVHITGAVNNPGVIKLTSGCRMIDAIEQAGGLTENANVDQLNLASILEDEDKIHIYAKGEVASNAEGAGATMNASGQISINTASLEELKTLPGIGDVIAQNIIRYREKNGLFKSLEELKEVDRIGDKMYEKIKDIIIL